MRQAVKEALRSGEAVAGHFWIPDGAHTAAGILRWSLESGATIEFIGDARDFPRDFESPGFVVYGHIDGGVDLTLLDCMMRSIALGDQPRRLSAATMALGAHTAPSQKWPRAIYSTTNLSEWRNDTGLRALPAARRRPRPGFTLRWQPPTVDTVRVAGADLTFRGRQTNSGFGGGPDFEARTWQEMLVVPDRPLTVSAALNTYGLPLLELTAFACDRPDAIDRETYVDPQQMVIEIWRQGRRVEPRPWRERFLFQASDLRDYPKSIRAWWRLHRKVWPALGLFGDHLLHDNTYSPERFLTTYSALEVYGRQRHKTTDLAALRSFADVDSKLIGCTNPSLKLIGKTRGYFAHFNNVKSDADLHEVQDNLMESTRRVAALMQACLLRDLRFSRAERQALLTRHFRRWPLI